MITTRPSFAIGVWSFAELREQQHRAAQSTNPSSGRTRVRRDPWCAVTRADVAQTDSYAADAAATAQTDPEAATTAQTDPFRTCARRVVPAGVSLRPVPRRMAYFNFMLIVFQL